MSEKRAKKDAEMNERKRAMKEKFRALDVKRKAKRPSSFKKRLARKIRNEEKARKAEAEAKAKARGEEERGKGPSKSGPKRSRGKSKLSKL